MQRISVLFIGCIPEFVHLCLALRLCFLYSLQNKENICFSFNLCFASVLLSSFRCPHLYSLVLTCACYSDYFVHFTDIINVHREYTYIIVTYALNFFSIRSYENQSYTLEQLVIQKIQTSA